MDDTALDVRPTVEIGTDHRGTLITLGGEIDVSAAQELAAAVVHAEQANRPTSIDASAITFMDSSGIALLARLATRTPGPLRVIDPPEVVRFLLDVTRIGDMVTIVDSTQPDGDTDPGPSAA